MYEFSSSVCPPVSWLHRMGQEHLAKSPLIPGQRCGAGTCISPCNCVHEASAARIATRHGQWSPWPGMVFIDCASWIHFSNGVSAGCFPTGKFILHVWKKWLDYVRRPESKHPYRNRNPDALPELSGGHRPLQHIKSIFVGMFMVNCGFVQFLFIFLRPTVETWKNLIEMTQQAPHHKTSAKLLVACGTAGFGFGNYGFW